ncbi:X-Pro dipeptidyl-peptidase (S15 family) [Dokdonia sp. MED134]|uniref:alpha/beta hydrolase family protein n=1 Tax=Dokdonia sp. MED134 TaxID=313590 RepID=UPI000068AC2A|nr:alpha/beta fold hydrolase [Dokdonia sp. MED134]EAQ40504.1 X-Pro dipeptidyl-peptidase (S15 family) [Dokdonia sp. MED134]
MRTLIILAVTFLTSFISHAQNVTGDWKGTVNFQGQSIDFAFHITQPQDSLHTTMDIPSQGLTGGKAANTTYTNDTLKVDFPQFKMRYIGVTKNDSIQGNLIQNNFPVPLTLVKGALVLNRPQQPKAPFNYDVQEVTFKNKEDGITLAGTLTLPKDIKNPPIAVIISGSGPQNRDGDMFGHSLYYVLADYLSSNGIGVLRYDERGVGASTGTFETAGIAQFTSDATAAIAYLKKYKKTKYSQVGLIGHSIGGIIAPQIAATNTDVAFTVMLAGPGIPGNELMLSQKEAMERLLNVPEAQIKQGQDLLGYAYDVIIQNDGTNAAIKDAVNLALKEKLGPMVPIQQVEAITDQITTPEIVSLLKATPASYLSAIKSPVIALNGKKDFQVPYEQNIAAIKEAFAAGNNKNARTVAFDDLNHLFQESTTGALSEYSEIEQTMAPKVLAFITKWIKEHTND